MTYMYAVSPATAIAFSRTPRNGAISSGRPSDASDPKQDPFFAVPGLVVEFPRMSLSNKG